MSYTQQQQQQQQQAGHHRPSIRSAASSTSPSWFEDLRTNCLARARNDRLQYVAEKRRLSSSSSTVHPFAQQLVQSELSRQRQHVMIVPSPTSSSSSSSSPAAVQNIHDTRYITDDDMLLLDESYLYELMQQVEAELERQVQREVEWIEHVLDQENAYFQNQMDEFDLDQS